jgi:hypothetical protein
MHLFYFVYLPFYSAMQLVYPCPLIQSNHPVLPPRYPFPFWALVDNSVFLSHELFDESNAGNGVPAGIQAPRNEHHKMVTKVKAKEEYWSGFK